MTVQLREFPQPGEHIIASRTYISHGGRGSNQAIQAARIGASVDLVAAIGFDKCGADARALWHRNRIFECAVEVTYEAETGSIIVLTGNGSDGSKIIAHGANAYLSTKMIERSKDRIATAALVLAQLETPLPVTRQAFAHARQHGVLTVLNAAPLDRSVDPSLLDLVDILIVNEIEGQVLTNSFVTGRELAERLLPLARSAVLVSAEREGAWLVRSGMSPLHVTPPDLDPIDTAGAGDALIGAFCGRLAMSGDFELALRWGGAAGALARLEFGVESSLPSATRIAAALETGMY